MKATATPFVHHALKDTILKIMESKQSCEVNAHFLFMQKGFSYLFLFSPSSTYCISLATSCVCKVTLVNSFSREVYGQQPSYSSLYLPSGVEHLAFITSYQYFGFPEDKTVTHVTMTQIQSAVVISQDSSD